MEGVVQNMLNVDFSVKIVTYRMQHSEYRTIVTSTDKMQQINVRNYLG